MSDTSTSSQFLVNGRATTGCGLAGDLNEADYGSHRADGDLGELQPTASHIRRQMEATPNRSLILYLAQLSDPEKMEDVIDLEFVNCLIQEGANVNCKDKYGQSVLHEVARTWHVDVAKFLVVELGANVNIGMYDWLQYETYSFTQVI